MASIIYSGKLDLTIVSGTSRYHCKELRCGKEPVAPMPPTKLFYVNDRLPVQEMSDLIQEA